MCPQIRGAAPSSSQSCWSANSSSERIHSGRLGRLNLQLPRENARLIAPHLQHVATSSEGPHARPRSGPERRGRELRLLLTGCLAAAGSNQLPAGFRSGYRNEPSAFLSTQWLPHAHAAHAFQSFEEGKVAFGNADQMIRRYDEPSRTTTLKDIVSPNFSSAFRFLGGEYSCSLCALGNPLRSAPRRCPTVLNRSNSSLLIVKCAIVTVISRPKNQTREL